MKTNDGPGFFERGSKIWQINREMALLLAGGRALLMQLAHPKVTAGVAQHSRFQDDPVGRLYRTMSRMWSIVFDDRAQARAALRQVEMVHRTVRGIVAADEPSHGGAAYSALDQELLLWVHATLIDSAMVAFDLFVAPLSAMDRKKYYDDSKKLAALFGIEEKSIPPSVEAFDTYMDHILASGQIIVGAEAKRLAHDVLYPRAWLLRPAAPGFRLVTGGLLPEKLRDGYGLQWNRTREKRLFRIARVIRLLLPLIPPILRIVPNARKNENAGRRPVNVAAHS
jgi:uncharacterized protein (DUF2236 family)